MANNDVKFASGAFATAPDYTTWHVDAFDFHRGEGAKTPNMLSVGLHARLIGHPARTAGLARLLAPVVARRQDTWLCRRLDISRHCLPTHPTHPAHPPRPPPLSPAPRPLPPLPPP